MSTKPLTLSLIIPAYNEQRHIRATLESVARQTVMPSEVIVVDNNSTDDTVKIAQEFPFVTVIHEKQQGISYSRNAGFNKSKSDIIGRIDADSILEQDWVKKVLYEFTTRSDVDGLAGMGVTPLFPFFKKPLTTLHMRMYFYNTNAYFNTVILWGGNFALRRLAWSNISDQVTVGDNNVHEDQDVSLLLQSKSHKIIKTYHIRVTAPDQSFRYFPKAFHYLQKRRTTSRIHQQKGNLPVSNHPLPWSEFIVSRIFGYIGIFFGTVTSLLIFPIDYIALRVCRAKHWFD